jgi:predicted transcriptional regulator
VKKYITELIEKELLEMNGDRFYVTDKGSEFIERYETLVSPLANRLFLE